MDSEDEHQVRLVPIGFVPKDTDNQEEHLQECIDKQQATIDYLKELAVQANLPLDSTRIYDGSNTYPNGWTEDNDTLLQTWRTQLFTTSFIYGVVLEKYKRKFIWIQIISAIMSAVITLLGVILSTLDSNNVWIDRGIGIAVAIIGAMVTVLTNIVKINGWDTYVDNITKLIQNVDNLYVRVTSQSYLPKVDRNVASDFIIEFQKDLNQILQNAPSISVSDYQMAEEEFSQDQTRNQKLIITPV